MDKKIIFAHDHIFYKDRLSGKVYSKTSLKQSAWDRYLRCFKKVKVVSRMCEIENIDKSKFSLSSREGIEYYDVASISGITNLLKNYKSVYKKVETQILESDGVIARLPSEIGSMAVDIAKKNNIPYAIELVACTWDGLWNYGTLQGKIYAPVSYIRTRWQVMKCKQVIYVTEKFLQKRYPNKNYNANCSNVELVCDIESDRVLMDRIAKINGLKEEITVGLIGNLEIKSKGIDVAIKALKKVQSYNANIKLYIVGGGEKKIYEALIEELKLEKNVKLEGVIPSGEMIYKWLDKMDIYIQPSFQEGLPRATIEAMSRGCLCIGSTAGGLPELLDENLIHKKGDIKALANLILYNSKNKLEMINQAKKNYYRAREYNKEKLEDERYVFWNKFGKGL